MTHIHTLRSGLVASIALLMVITAPLAAARSSGSQTDHMALHGAGCSAGSPTVTTCNADMGSGMSGMGMASGSGHGVMDGMMDPERFDLVFIDLMLQHHASAIAMAQAVIDDGTDPVLIEIAEEIIGTQSEEMVSLQTWRDRWYPNSAPLTLPLHGEGADDVRILRELDHLGLMGILDPIAAVDALRAAPETIGPAFANAMILHHQGATMLLEMAVLHAGHPELAGLAGVMLEADHNQVMTMQEWQLA